MELISIEKSQLETLIFSYICNNLNTKKNKEISISDGFLGIKKSKYSDKYILDIEYKITSIYHEEDYPYITENYNLFHDEVSVTVGHKDCYTRSELKSIAVDMHLRNENTVAFILKLLNKDVRFENE